MGMSLIRRNVETIVKETLNDTPVTVIQGARQVGKSTLAAMIAEEINSLSITLDSEAALIAAKENPYEFVSQYHKGLLIIDEVQKCPELLRAIKLSVDRERRPGRFMITGSANLLNLKGSSESLAGRAETVTLRPFSVGEVNGKREDIVSRLINREPLSELQKAEPLSRAEYAVLVEKGGYPDAISRAAKRRRTYFSNYVSRVLDHDADEISGLTHLDRLHKLYSVLAGQSSKIFINANISRLVGIPESSMRGYMSLLEDLCLINLLPAWGKNYSRRAISKQKILLSDTGLICSVQGISADFISDIENGNELGPLLETFVIGEILKQQVWSDCEYSLFHFRDFDEKEIDLLIELSDGRIIAIEIKSASSISRKDFTGMKMLRDTLGKRFHCGIVLYTGTETLPFGDKLFASPISVIWQ
jgi:predicted AAA+ superfamily ATPase